ncbi:F-box domain-containing protein [Mycena indigotica]|uniref:F-box domain-containing protein n=1 Tax=Mycena indigotica TaxID=2126181 RepID=A0A8H6SDS3_9AGAR|nr:F-box domain-containing protein [Mycena indigotica]KAF7297098.1 F-box domain-containing protein [Mycena indigotica]
MHIKMNPIHLPDEIISQILIPALEIPDKTFADTSVESPFAKYRTSSSIYLSVCKAWYRVGTPNLYQTVILRSRAQAAALEWTLKRVNGLFGRYIRKLRLEGAYGTAIRTILQAAPNISDLFVAVNLWPGDDSTGLCLVLADLNPRRVILFDTPNHGPRTNDGEVLRQKLKHCIRMWQNLTVFEFPDACASQWSLMIDFSPPLSLSSNIRTIVIPFTPIFLHGQVAEHLGVMAQSPTLQRIFMRPPREWDNRLIISFEAITQSPVLARLVELPSQRMASTTLFDTVTLRFSTSGVPDHIWNRVLFYALSLDPNKPQPLERKPYLGLVTVCKRFERLAQPHLHSTMVLRGSFAMMDFLRRLERDPCIRPALRALYFELPDTAWTVSLDQLFEAQPSTCSLNLLSLIGLEPFSLSARLFNSFAQHSGHSLARIEGLLLTRDHGKESPAVWGSFKALSVIRLDNRVFWQATSQEIPFDALANLRRLELGCHHPGTESLIRVFAGMNLPALRRAAFTFVASNNQISSVQSTDKLYIAIKRFLGRHGPGKLEWLSVPSSFLEQDAVAPVKWLKVFELCDKMAHVEISCWGDVSRPNIFKSTTKTNLALEKVSFRLGADGHRQWRTMERQWTEFLEACDLSLFPNLREIWLPCVKWPTNEHEIAKSMWVDTAELLLDAGIRLLDQDGLGWRKRLNGVLG